MCSRKLLFRLFVAVFGLMHFVGCAEQAATTVSRFTAGDTDTYKLTVSSERIVEFRGSLAEEKEPKGGRTIKRVDMLFTRQIQAVDEKGFATAKITVEKLIYSHVIKDEPALVFDSTKDANSPLAALIGQSYTIEIDPNGSVTNLIDAEQARKAVQGNTDAHKAAMRLLEPQVIQQFHSVPLPPAAKKQLKAGYTWENIKNLDFGMLGTRNYKRLYSVTEVDEIDGAKTVFVKMKASPDEADHPGTSGRAPDLEIYTGLMRFDFDSFVVNQYSERLEADWFVIDSAAELTDNSEPDSIRMGVVRVYDLTKIDR